LMMLGDAGPAYAATCLTLAAKRLDMTTLPTLFPYTKDYESEEDKQKRLEKAEARKQMKLARAAERARDSE